MGTGKGHQAGSRDGGQGCGLPLVGWAWAAQRTAGLHQVPDCDVCPAGTPPKLHWEGAGSACSHEGPALCSPGLWVAPAGRVPSPWWCWHLRGTPAPRMAPDGWGGWVGAVLAPGSFSAVPPPSVTPFFATERCSWSWLQVASRSCLAPFLALSLSRAGRGFQGSECVGELGPPCVSLAARR